MMSGVVRNVRDATCMSNVLRLAIVDPNDSQRESLKSMLLGMDPLALPTCRTAALASAYVQAHTLTCSLTV